MGLGFALTNVLIDPNSHFVFLLCSLYGFKCVIAGKYISPPFSAETLKTLANYMSRFPGLPLLAVGDFNNYLNYVKD